MILFINACVRAESRTYRIAKALLEKLGDYEEIALTQMGLQPLNEEALKKRTELLAEHDYQNRMFDLARQFANADKIVIAAPHWDLSFPAILIIYI
ncbi:MAG: NAD(P)H-dependent oxidoreductase [Clostridia bacterium]|nr:NAD(P)H-dependent oxidoreductase [Clostridia bacterium]